MVKTFGKFTPPGSAGKGCMSEHLGLLESFQLMKGECQVSSDKSAF
jgi:hypothetical protein